MRERDKRGDLWERIEGDLESLGEEPEEEGERVPCPDGSCVGLIGGDGFCGICGRAPSGDERLAGAAEAGHGETDAEDEEPEEDEARDRVLCSDEACVGLVGEEGYCGVCGLFWKGEGYGEGEERVYRGETKE